MLVLSSCRMGEYCLFGCGHEADLNSNVVGHAHVVIQKMDSLQSTAVLPANTFAFFKGFDFKDSKLTLISSQAIS
jgi:hypothetical protein